MIIDLLMTNIGQLVTMAGPSGPRSGAAQREIGLIENGMIATSGGTIVAAGPAEQLQELPDVAAALNGDVRVLDAGGCVVTPGLVDSHTHLSFFGTRQDEFEMRARGATYAEIMAAGGGIYASVEKTRAASMQQIQDAAAKSLSIMLAHGTTTVEAKSGYGLDLETEVKQLTALRALAGAQPVEIVRTFLGAHAVPKGLDGDTAADWLCAEAIPEIGRLGLARFCDVFCERNVFTIEQSERILVTGQRHGMAAKIHADELFDTGGADLAARIGAVSADHLHCANESGLAVMAAAGVIATVLPGTGVFLGMTHHAPARRMVELGVPIAIATDFNPGSCYSESLPLMLSFACTQLGLTPAEALTGATINGAYAVGLGDRAGSLEPGKQADLVLWDADDYRMIAYHMGINLVRTVVKRGQVVHEKKGS